MVKRFGLVIILCIAVGCSESPEKPETLVDEETYISLLVELQLVRSYSETDQMDEAGADSLRNQIFEDYEVSDTAFWESHTYYQQFPKEQKKRIDEAIEQLRIDRTGEPEEGGEEKQGESPD